MVRVASRRVALWVLAVATVALVVGAVAGCSMRGRPVERRLLVVGIDGMDWALTQRLAAEGRLPHLSALAASGVSCPLRTLEPMEKSPVIWTSIATGKLPEQHGIGDLTAGDGKRLLTSNVRTAKAFWDILGAADRTVTVIGWLVSWPAQPVNGVMVTDYFSFVPREGMPFPENLTYPETLAAEIESLRVVGDDVNDEEVSRIADPDAALTDAEAKRLPFEEMFAEMRAKAELKTNLNALRDFLAGDRTFLGVALERARTRPADLFVLYLRGLDWTSHRFWAAAHPTESGIPVSRTDTRVFGKAVERYYEHADEMIGAIVRAYGDSATVIVCSDHGFRGPGPDRRPGGINDHAPLGVFYMSGEGIKAGEVIPERGVCDVTPTILALFGLPVGEDMDGAPIEEALTPDFLREHPVRRIPTHEGTEEGA